MVGRNLQPSILREYDIRGIVNKTFDAADFEAIARGFATEARSRLGGKAPTAVKYAWGIVDCCDITDPTTFTSKPCIANCPIMGSTGLPANPFIARIEGGKCECIAPQVC